MTPEYLEQVWQMLDRDQLAEITREGPEPLFATISGAHLYGFASADSDVDLRGVFMLSAKEMLGLQPPKETISIEDKSVIDLDWVAHDVRKFARLMTHHNGYVLEQLYSPLVVITSPAHEELMELGKGCITKPTCNHYLGFARGRVKRLAEPDPTVKHLLYAYRVFLTGIHLMRTGEVESNLISLNMEAGVPEIDRLIQRKQEGTETMKLDASEIEAHVLLLGRLEDSLRAAKDASSLPDEPTTVDALQDFVVRIRLEASDVPNR